MLAYAISTALLVQAPSQQPNPAPPPPERIGAWEIRVSVDPVTDEVDIGAYLGTTAEQFVIACGKGYPDSTVVVWRSSRAFRESAVGRVPVAHITYRFDQDAPVATLARLRDNYRVDFDVADLPRITDRIGSSTRLVLRDRLETAHTVVLDLVPADTERALQRLNEVCGTRLGVAAEAAA